MTSVGVELGARRYDVRVGRPAPGEAADLVVAAVGSGGTVTGAAVLIDETVAQVSPRAGLVVEALRARLPELHELRLPAGEACKTLGEVDRTAGWLASRGLDRSGLIVGVGGGAATDHVGFVAAVYLRGVRFALFPTTLLAMVDASVGGKTAVDLAAGKNLVGAFHQPISVVADLAFLQTLPTRQRAAGLAEVVKCGLIGDPTILDLLERHAPGAAGSPLSDDVTADLVVRAVRVKAAIVGDDERESGRRALLNFGHTLGHALEAESGYALLHGEAVSLGMVAALSLGAAQGLTPPGLVQRATALLVRLGLPVDLAGRITPAVLARVGVDKKRRGRALRFVFCSAAGSPFMKDIDSAELAALLSPPVRT